MALVVDGRLGSCHMSGLGSGLGSTGRLESGLGSSLGLGLKGSRVKRDREPIG